MNIVTLIYALAALAGGTSGVLAWVAKIRWSKEYIDAKNETIKAKEAQIERLAGDIKSVRENNDEIVAAKDIHIATLREQTAPQVLALYKSTMEALELAQGQFKQDLAMKDQQLSEALARGTATESELSMLRDEKTEFEERLQRFKDALADAHRAAAPAQAAMDRLGHVNLMRMLDESNYKRQISDLEGEINKLRAQLEAGAGQKIGDDGDGHGGSLPSPDLSS